jgi:23S rRNA (cytidine1920-2'-O)/16S rRNA (cytidine1409-2'-O)-methyltransferase
VHRRVLEDVLSAATELHLALRGLMPSPLRGPAGNIEFLAWWRLESEAMDEESAVVACLAEVE